MGASLPEISSGAVLLVDAGGSKTTAAVARCNTGEESEIVGRFVAGPGNPTSVGFKSATKAWSDAVQGAVKTAGLADQSICYLLCGIAGAGRPELANEARKWFATRFPWAVVQVIPDVALALGACSSDGVGISLVAGTGSIALGIDRGGRTARAGGWGLVLGDEGSGAWIGLEALRAVTREVDGRGESTRLTALILSQRNCSNLADLVVWGRNALGDPKMLADLAPLVLQMAYEGDHVATKILDKAASHLADLVLSVVKKLGWSEGKLPLSLSGGVLVHFEPVRTRVSAIIKEKGLSPQEIIVPDPLLAALRIAERWLILKKWRHWDHLVSHNVSG